MEIAILVTVFFGSLLINIPIVFAFGITSVVMITSFSNIPLEMVPEVMYNSLNSYSLMSIPFFVIAAQFMLRGGVAKHLYSMANAFIGWIHGGVAIAGVVSCMIFAAICGSSVATALTMGVIVVPYMIKYGYGKNYSVGVVAAAGTMGIVIPPSIPLILYGIIAEQSIPRLFLAGIPAGILEGLLYITYIFITSKKYGYRGSTSVNGKEIVKYTIKALPGLSLPCFVLIGIYAGIVTVTEAAALAVFLAAIVSIFVYKEVTIKEILPITVDGMKSAGMIMIIISTALLFGSYLTQSGYTAKLVSHVHESNLSPWMFLILVNIMLLILGMFLEVVSVMYIVLPIVLPLLSPLGIDPIHFAIIILVNMEVALITPPVGLNLYVLSKATNTPVSSVIKGAFPYVVLGLLQLIIVTYWSSFSTFLPDLIMPK